MIHITQKKVSSIYLKTLILFLFISPVFAQDLNWKKEFSKDGEMEILSRFSSLEDKNGDSRQIVEYKASVKANVSYEKCLEVIKNSNHHPHFILDAKESRTIKNISETEWIVYYFIDSRWPMPDSDVVVRMDFQEDKDKQYAIFVGTSDFEAYPKTDVRRMIYNDVSYSFRRLDNDQVFIEIYAKITPVIKAPDWLVSAWFPDGPADMLKGIIKYAKN